MYNFKEEWMGIYSEWVLYIIEVRITRFAWFGNSATFIRVILPVLRFTFCSSLTMTGLWQSILNSILLYPSTGGITGLKLSI